MWPMLLAPSMKYCMVSRVLEKGGMTSHFDVLVDSDAFVGWLYPNDAHFQQVSARFEALEQQGKDLVTTSLVVAETATVLSYRQGQPLARDFLQKIADSRLPVIHITEELQRETLKLFQAQKARGTSMVDCSNVVVMSRFNVPTILSFDKFYKKLGLKILS
jgi:predicted nucleic acid-binding protein